MTLNKAMQFRDENWSLVLNPDEYKGKLRKNYPQKNFIERTQMSEFLASYKPESKNAKKQAMTPAVKLLLGKKRTYKPNTHHGSAKPESKNELRALITSRALPTNTAEQ